MSDNYSFIKRGLKYDSMQRAKQNNKTKEEVATEKKFSLFKSDLNKRMDEVTKVVNSSNAATKEDKKKQKFQAHDGKIIENTLVNRKEDIVKRFPELFNKEYQEKMKELDKETKAKEKEMKKKGKTKEKDE